MFYLICYFIGVITFLTGGVKVSLGEDRGDMTPEEIKKLEMKARIGFSLLWPIFVLFILIGLIVKPFMRNKE
jgi:hypothetical protein